MRNVCRMENAPYPKIEYTDTHFYIMFKQSKGYLKLTEKEKGIEKSLNNRQKRALHFMRKTGRLSMKDYIKLCPEVNRKTLTRDLNFLIKSGLIVRKGRGKRDLHYILS